MWETIKKFFKSSETIAWARFNGLLAFAGSITAALDPVLLQSVLTPKTFLIYIAINAGLTEYLRRRRDEELKKRGE